AVCLGLRGECLSNPFRVSRVGVPGLPGCAARPWENGRGDRIVYPERVAQPARGTLYNPFRVGAGGLPLVPRVRCATLGCGVQRLRRKEAGALAGGPSPLAPPRRRVGETLPATPRSLHPFGRPVPGRAGPPSSG